MQRPVTPGQRRFAQPAGHQALHKRKGQGHLPGPGWNQRPVWVFVVPAFTIHNNWYFVGRMATTLFVDEEAKTVFLQGLPLEEDSHQLVKFSSEKVRGE